MRCERICSLGRHLVSFYIIMELVYFFLLKFFWPYLVPDLDL